ncbi:MAG: hypothetical protein Q8Q60_04520 [Candidatus Chromulinivorax sp.]|nr:hypothetical protein [Candidatus Chromulinivorax sp.]
MKNVCLIFMAIAMIQAEYIFAGKIRELQQQKYDAEMLLSSSSEDYSSEEDDDDIQIYEDFEIRKEQRFHSSENLLDYNSASSSSDSQKSEQSFYSLSYNEEREPLMSDEEGSDADDDVDVDSADDEKEFLRIHRSDAARILRLMNHMGSSLAIDEHICDSTVSIIDQIRKENQLMKQAHAKRYAEVLSDDNL